MIKKILLILLLIGFSITSSIKAQEKRGNVSWFDLGLGPGLIVGEELGFSGLFGTSFRFKRHILSVRMAGVSKFLGVGYGDLGILYGISFMPDESDFFASMNTGISWVIQSQTEFNIFGGNGNTKKLYNGVGVPFQLSLNQRLSDEFGMGVIYYGNINPSNFFGGLLFSIQLGSLR